MRATRRVGTATLTPAAIQLYRVDSAGLDDEPPVHLGVTACLCGGYPEDYGGACPPSDRCPVNGLRGDQIETEDGSGSELGDDDGRDPAKPCNDANNNRSRFFEQLPLLRSVAAALNVPEDYIVGFASYESGWLDNHNFALHNLWGLTRHGGRNQSFPTFQAGADAFISTVRPFVENSASISAFVAGLRQQGYNARNPRYDADLTNRIENIANWESICGVR